MALRNGSRTVRLWFGLVALVNVAVAFWGVTGTHAEQRFTAALSMVVGLFVLWLLFGSQRAMDYFGDGEPEHRKLTGQRRRRRRL